MPRRKRELRTTEMGDKVCPMLLAACLAAGKDPTGLAECWRKKCQLWIPHKLACGLELLRLEDTLAESVGAQARSRGPAQGA